MAEPIKNEEWRVIKSFSAYAISDYGRVKRIKPYNTTKVGRILKPRLVRRYLSVMLYPSGQLKKIHHLVLEAFISSRPEGKQCNHKDGNKLNNHRDNLEWITASENVKHSFDVLGRINPQGEQNGMAKLTNNEVLQIRKMYATGDYKQKHLAKLFNINKGHIGYIIHRKAWKHI